MRFNRVFVIVLDSLGIGPMADSARFDDAGAGTLLKCFKLIGISS